MRIAVILNRDGGTLRTLDMATLVRTIEDRLSRRGHQVHAKTVAGDEVVDELRGTVENADRDVVMAGGGDGTISAAAGLLMNSDKALAILPAGTMNLFARSLGIPLDLEEAVAAAETGTLRRVDVASANDRPFVHQFSIGMHPKLIELRERRSFASRLGKMRASAMAAVDTFLRPPRISVKLTLDGVTRTIVTSSLGVTNNLFGEGHIPYADRPDGGVLGIYIAKATRRRDMLVFLLNLALGRWRANDQVEVLEAKEVKIRLQGRHPRFGCSIDGELCEMEEETVLKIHPAALSVIAPAAS